jgi:hypothetical protein
MMPSSIPKSYCNRILATLPAADMLTSPAVHDVFPLLKMRKAGCAEQDRLIRAHSGKRH